MICSACSGPQLFTNGHRVCANCGVMEDEHKPDVVDGPSESEDSVQGFGEVFEGSEGQKDGRPAPQTVRDGRRNRTTHDGAAAPEPTAPPSAQQTPAFFAGLPEVHLDPEAATLVADIERFGRSVIPQACELWTRVRALWNR